MVQISNKKLKISFLFTICIVNKTIVIIIINKTIVVVLFHYHYKRVN